LNNVADNKELFLILISAEAGGRAVWGGTLLGLLT
jgi:hypothetical protein